MPLFVSVDPDQVFAGTAPTPLGELAESTDGARVLTIGSLSKVLSPGLPVGYVVGPWSAYGSCCGPGTTRRSNRCAVHLPVRTDEVSFLGAARDDGLALTRGSAFYPADSRPPAGTVFLRLPFQALDPEEFAEGVRRLAAASQRAA